MLIKLFYFEGCPSWKSALENMHTALAELSINAKIELVLVESDEDAAKQRFLGSPSFQINGQDLWPEQRASYHLGCRVYLTGEGLRGVPTVSMLKEKLSKRMAVKSTWIPINLFSNGCKLDSHPCQRIPRCANA